MSAEMFVLWLKGYFDMREATGSQPRGLTGAQVQLVQHRLSQVSLGELDKMLTPLPSVEPAASSPKSLAGGVVTSD